MTNDKPYWAIEYACLKAREDLESECWNAETLQDAILCGANMTYLDGKRVGYVEEDGVIEKYDEWNDGDKAELCLSDIKVEFEELGYDADGYTVAYFSTKGEE